MPITSTAPFRVHAEHDGFDPEWLLAHVRRHLPGAPANVDAEFSWSPEFNELLMALNHRAIAALHIANFKAFGAKPQRFPLAPITLLFGPNGAGKSSLIQALLYAQHSVARDTLDVRHPKGSGTLVDLGRFTDLVHGHDPDTVVQIGFEYAHLHRRLGTESRPTIWWVALRKAAVESATLEMDGEELAHFLPGGSKPGLLRCVRLNTTAQLFRPVISDLSAIGQSELGADEIRRIVDDTSRSAVLVRRGLLPREIRWDDSDSGLIESTAKYLRQDVRRLLRKLVSLLFEQAEYFLRCLDYLSPIRLPPGRDFENIDKDDINHWHNGGSSWLKLAEHADVRERLNRWFAELQAGQPRGIAHYGFEVEYDLNQIEVEATLERVAHDYLAEKNRAHEEDRGKRGDRDADERFYNPFDQLDATELIQRFKEEVAANKNAATGRRLIIRDLRVAAKPRVNPAEISSGIQYLIPVLVEGFGGGAFQQVIEEPELHAHPALQAEIGDLFLERALSHPKPSWRKRFIIETHSEHLILRILRRIRQTSAAELPSALPKVVPEDVSVVYAEPTKEGTKLHQLRITPDGDFADPWPHGFFTERGGELFS